MNNHIGLKEDNTKMRVEKLNIYVSNASDNSDEGTAG